MENSIIILQEMVSHQGEDIARLSEELYTQQQELAALREQIAKINIKLQAVGEGAPAFAPLDQEPPPPHYWGSFVLDIYVDADACPVKEEALRVAVRHQLQVYMVSNAWLRLMVGPNVHKILVEAGADAADDWIVEHITEGDIAITADILLAERCLKKDAKVVSPSGKPFTPDNIGVSLAMRSLSAHLRETGEISGGGPSFTKQDRSRFLQAFEEAIQKIKRKV